MVRTDHGESACEPDGKPQAVDLWVGTSADLFTLLHVLMFIASLSARKVAPNLSGQLPGSSSTTSFALCTSKRGSLLCGRLLRQLWPLVLRFNPKRKPTKPTPDPKHDRELGVVRLPRQWYGLLS